MKRTLTRDAPSSVECGWCGSSDVEQITFSDCPAGYLYDGDDFTCRECGASGVGGVDDDGDGGTDHYVSQWSDGEEEVTP